MAPWNRLVFSWLKVTMASEISFPWSYYRPGLKYVSMYTISRMLGLWKGCSSIQSRATKNICIASSLGTLFILGSMICITSSFFRWHIFFTHPVMFIPSSYSHSSTDFLPVISSSRTTPKLYTSLFSSTFSVYAYSANSVKVKWDRKLLQLLCTTKHSEHRLWLWTNAYETKN